MPVRAVCPAFLALVGVRVRAVTLVRARVAERASLEPAKAAPAAAVSAVAVQVGAEPVAEVLAGWAEVASAARVASAVQVGVAWAASVAAAASVA